MLEKVDLSKSLKKSEMKEEFEKQCLLLSELQRKCKEAGIPVMIVFEGLSAAGKGVQINELIAPLDPRGFYVVATKRETEEEKRYPFLWRFWTKTPSKGRFAIFDCSWYRRVSTDRFEERISDKELETAFRDIKSFEHQLSVDGTVIIKFFLYISKKEQKKRFEVLESRKEQAWRVTDSDRRKYKHYDSYVQMTEEMLQRTDSGHAPWTIVEATDREYASMKIISTVAERLEYELEKRKSTAAAEGIDLHQQHFRTKVLEGVDLKKSLTKDEYKEQLKKLQKRLALLHDELYQKRIPVVLAFEGWDAAGKGGAIKRLTSALDPRGYTVNPTAAPNDIEKVHHYLWRFWNEMPKTGHIALFDRTWYGRVMVERIEGFCRETEWKRAYTEINEMEEHLTNSGAVVLKFWLHIDKEEQERRFKERMEIPEKQWKITDEDWRNREKWDQYEAAVDEMLVRTSTTYAPWIIVEGNCKYYARIKVLKEVIRACEEKLNTH